MKRILLLLFVVNATLLSSCLRTNLSGWADNVGRLEPYPVRNQEGQISTKDWRVYQLDGQYYLQADLKYDQKATRIFYADSFIDGPHGGILLNRHITAPARSYMIRLQPDVVKKSLGRHTMPTATKAPSVIPSEEFDIARATPCPLKNAEPLLSLYSNATRNLPEQRTAAHYAMQPVAAVLWCADIPLSIAYNIIGTPYGFIRQLTNRLSAHSTAIYGAP